MKRFSPAPKIEYASIDNDMGQYHTDSKTILINSCIRKYPTLLNAVIRHEVSHSKVPQRKLLGFDFGIFTHLAIDFRDMPRIYELEEYWTFYRKYSKSKWYDFFEGWDKIIYYPLIWIYQPIVFTLAGIQAVNNLKRKSAVSLRKK